MRRIEARRHIRRQVAARRPNPDNPAAGRKAVRPGNVVDQNSAAGSTVSSAPSFTLPMSACAVGTSSMIAITRLPAGALSPSASVTTTAKLELLDGSTSVLSISV